MHLQRIEMSGFKSFPDRAELSFEHGVTAIVGPNGCGKSNVVDAIAWVLGEQSAKSLRGDRMEDVIFSGSDGRRPTGAAEVRLMLKGVPTGGGNGSAKGNGHDADGGSTAATGNGNGHEPTEHYRRPIARDIEVARRLFRSGESEYLIDGQVCRLRDIQDLLMTAGLGVKGYAVIEQGKIGQILSARPTDRRQLIEEAAGVTKYKSRRRAAELKLEAAQQNLVRVEDIIFELEKQRAALKRQAAKARRYRRLRDHLRRWEKVLFARRYRVLGRAIEAARERLVGARERDSSASARLAQLETALEGVRLEMASGEAQAVAAREAAHSCELAMERRQQRIEFDRRQLEALAGAAGDIRTELRSLEARREPERVELEERRRAAVTADRDRQAAIRLLAEAEEAHAVAFRKIEGYEGDVEAARSEVFAAINAATALRHAIEHASAGQNRLSEELAKLEIEAGDLEGEAAALGAERARLIDSLSAAISANDVVELERTTKEADLLRTRTVRELLAREVRMREQAIAGIAARLRSLEQMDASRAGYGDGARLILAESNGAIRQRGSVADYLEVDREYERAVEGCLGDLLQHVVVERREHAATGFEFLKTRRGGRCGFVIAEPANYTAPGSGGAVPDGLEPLASVVRATGPYTESISRAMGDAWIAQTLDQALEGARVTTAPIATLAGVVVRGPHVIQGGAREESLGILATKREIKELRDRLAADRETLQASVGRLVEREAEIAGLQNALVGLDARRHEHEKIIVGCELSLRQIEEGIARVGRKRTLIATETRRAEEERAGLESRQTEAREAIGRLEADQRAADERFTAAQRRLFEARENVEALSRGAAEAKAAHAGLVERAAAIATEVRRLEEAGEELEKRLSVRLDDLARSGRRSEELQQSIGDAERGFVEDMEAFECSRSAVRLADDRVNELQGQFQAREAEIREARRTIDALRAELNQHEVTRATAEADLAHLAATCHEAVAAPLDEVAADVERMEREGTLEAIPEPAGEEDVESEEETPPLADSAGLQSAHAAAGSAEEAIAQLKAKIDRLGPVNMMAIEQFDELEGRHGFLTTQRQDLVDSIAATGEAIRKIDRTTRERFSEAFESIQHHFAETFTTLFGGGRAGLVLLDDNDPLESGIDIIAQPPGKRLQSVQLLSGGEKALTAIALMFAIFKYRPSPFCLLDEIDAPLDDANIGRFVQMLRSMLRHTQFILITHNRRTMEIADRLYGVTMEEPGVSKLVSVRLN